MVTDRKIDPPTILSFWNLFNFLLDHACENIIWLATEDVLDLKQSEEMLFASFRTFFSNDVLCTDDGLK